MVHANPGGALERPATRRPAARRSATRRSATGPAAVLAALLFLAACASGGGVATGVADATWYNPLGIGAAPTVPPPAEGVTMVARPADPVAAFLARAQPGQQETLPLGGGPLVTVRYVRSYNAASGRECRELQLSSGGGSVYCRDPAAGWVAARPLLRGGAVYRP